MFNIPKHITIYGRKFKVVRNVTTEKMKEIHDEEYNDEWGLCNFSTRTIYLKKHHTAEEEFTTFVHECVHIVQYITGLHQTQSVKLREIWCESIANMVVDILRGITPR